MGTPVVVYGKSGAGKSYSLKRFGPDEIALINQLGKPLPVRSRFTINYKPKSVDSIIKTLRGGAEKGYKAFVIDDAGYIQTQLFMSGHRDKKGGSSYDLYNDIGDAYWQIMNTISELPDDCIVYLMFHETSNDYGDCKIRTIGKLLDEKICLEGLCTVLIHAVVENGTHLFKVQASENDIAKSPEGMFPGESIPNDLKAVDTAIREYYKGE